MLTDVNESVAKWRCTINNSLQLFNCIAEMSICVACDEVTPASVNLLSCKVEQLFFYRSNAFKIGDSAKSYDVFFI